MRDNLENALHCGGLSQHFERKRISAQTIINTTYLCDLDYELFDSLYSSIVAYKWLPIPPNPIKFGTCKKKREIAPLAMHLKPKVHIKQNL